MQARTILGVLGLILAVAVLVEIVLISRQVLTWIVIGIFFTLALNPVGRLVPCTAGYRSAARLLGRDRLPVLVFDGGGAGRATCSFRRSSTRVNHLVRPHPEATSTTSRKGKGKASAFSRRKYHIVERGAERAQGRRRGEACSASAAPFSPSRRALITIPGRLGDDHVHDLLHAPRGAALGRAPLLDASREGSQSRWRTVGHDIYRTVGGYVAREPRDQHHRRRRSARRSSYYVLGVPLAIRARAAGRDCLDLIPLAGATIAAAHRRDDLRSSTRINRRGSWSSTFFPHLPAAREPCPPAGRSTARTVKLSPLLGAGSPCLIGAEPSPGFIGALAARSRSRAPSR